MLAMSREPRRAHHFICQHEHVVPGADLGNLLQLLASKALARWVMRSIDDDDLGLVGKGSPADAKSVIAGELPS